MTVEIPGYKIIRTLGKGGMATVYLAEQEIFERQVALKVMSKALSEDPTFGERFFREAKIVSQLVHPNIVTVHDVGVHGGVYYLSMEYIDGKDLRFLRAELTLAQKINAVKDIARALFYAGSKGYVHRDIKPENIMFHTADGRAVLTDFGIARATKTDKSMTQTGVAIGTPHYMSPEQAKGKPVDPRSDLYSLGVVFFQLLSGRVPYDAESAVAIGIKHITEPVPLLPVGYEKVQPIIDTLMAKKPNDRYQSAMGFVEEVEDINVKDLESVVKWAQANDPSNERSGSDSAKETARSGQEADDEEEPLIRASRPHIPALTEDIERFTVAYDAYEYFELEKSSSWPWYLGILIFVGIGGFVFHNQKPELVSPWLEKAGEVYDSASSKTKSLYQEVKDSVEQGFTEVTKPIEENVKKNTLKAAGQQTDRPPLSSRPSSLVADPVSEAATGETSIHEGANLLEKNKVEEKKEEVVSKAAEPGINALGNDDAPKASSVLPSERIQELPSQESPQRNPKGESDVRDTSLELRDELVELKEQVNTLESLYETDKGFLADLVSAYKELLVKFPDDTATLQSRNRLQAMEIKGIRDLAQAGKSKAAEKRLLQVKYLFAGLADDELAVLEKQLNNQKLVKEYLSRGEAKFKKNQLIHPVGDSAVDLYSKVLSLEPTNKLAQKRLGDSAEKLFGRAKKSFKGEDYSSSADLLTKVLSIDSGHAKAKKLQLQVNNERAKHRAIDALLVRARQQLKDGLLFKPPGGNALDSYKRILEKSPGHREAEEGIISVVDSLSTYVWNLVGSEQFNEARDALVEPRKAAPTNDRIHSLALAVEEVISERELAKPSVSVHASAVAGQFTNEVEQLLRAGDNIFVRLDYLNLHVATDAAGTTLSVMLVRVSDGLEVANITENVMGESGRHETVFQLKDTSLSSGDYSLEVRMNDDVLTALPIKLQ